MEKFLFAELFLLRKKLTFVMDYVILMVFLIFYCMIS